MKINIKNDYTKDNYIVFMIKTNGYKKDDEIVEYAFIEYEKKVAVKQISSFVLPTTTTYNLKQTDEKNIYEINKHVDKIAEFIDGKCLVTHNLGFLISYLESAFQDIDISVDCVDLVQIVNKKYELEKYNLNYIAKHFNLNDFENDCKSACLVINEILNNV